MLSPKAYLTASNKAPDVSSLPQSSGAGDASPKFSAASALALLAPFEPVAVVGYQSRGRLLIIGADDRVRQAATALSGRLSAAVFWTGKAAVPAFENVEMRSGEIESLEGYLGAFLLHWRRGQGAAPEVAEFDLVLDLQDAPAFTMHQPPQGYFAIPATDSAAFEAAVAELPDFVGEFEKPKFFNYKESLCAHSRSKKSGCTKCIDICSTQAISSDGDNVVVDPHLCMGCGACATVCPSGAMNYQYPRVADRGAQLRAVLGAYREQKLDAQPAPVVVFHNETDGGKALDTVGLPENALAIPAWHVASIGLDVMLGAIAYGAGGVLIVAEGSEAPDYVAALRAEMQTGETLLHALGFVGEHFAVCSADDVAARLAAIATTAKTVKPATFHLSNDKRATLEFAIEHLAKFAPAVPEVIPLSPKAMWGAVVVNKDKCTMCLACAGACPESALMDGGADAALPQLKFLERNCVQCGLCEATCPESAISLTPRLLMTDVRKKEVVLNETEPFNCISCGKALGTRKLIDSMMSKLAGHSMFQAEGSLDRLKMCADCRVVDMMSNKHEMSILTGKPIE